MHPKPAQSITPAPAHHPSSPPKLPCPGAPRAGARASVVPTLTSSASCPRSSGFSSVKRSSCSPAMVISCSSSPARARHRSGQVLSLVLFAPALQSFTGIPPIGMGPKSASLHTSAMGTWCFSLSRGCSEPLCTEQTVPRWAQLPAPTQLQLFQLRTNLSPGHDLGQTEGPASSVHAGHLSKHPTQSKNIQIYIQLSAQVKDRKSKFLASFRLQIGMDGTEADLPAQAEEGLMFLSDAGRQRDVPSRKRTV